MEEQSWHRRQAIRIVAQLPEDGDDAIAILRAAERFVAEFISTPDHLIGAQSETPIKPIH